MPIMGPPPPAGGEPHLGLIPSVPYKNHRARVIFDRVYMQPATQTFHEFLVNVVLWTFGETWWKTQVGMKEPDRHVVVRWKYDFAASARRAVEAGRKATPGQTAYAAPPSGPSWALVSLGYDLFCLQAKNRLPDSLAERLRNDQYFQGARYEIAVAAIVARAGFEITFTEPPKTSGEKVCEFLATHQQTKITVAIEAKSRRRKGVLNEDGVFEPTADATWIYKRIKEASKQRLAGRPFLLFVDMNFPLSPDTPPDDRPWAKDLKAALETFGTATPEKPDPFNAIVITNFSHHFHPTESHDRKGEWGVIVAPHPEAPISDTRVLGSLMESLSHYDRIPSEV